MSEQLTLALTEMERLEARWEELDAETEADERAVLSGVLDKNEYITRDLARQEERKQIEARAQELREPQPTCCLCDAPAPAVAVLGDWEVCEEHYNSLAAPEGACEVCGGPLSQDDIDAGETTCLDCAAELITAEIDLESPLLATVRLRLKGQG